MTRRTTLTAMIAVVVLLPCKPTWAGHQPTAKERERIEAALRAPGFRSWEKLELDDGV
jgi:hypothetical protein